MELVERDDAAGQVADREEVGVAESGRKERQLTLRLPPFLVDRFGREARLTLAAEAAAQRA